MSHVIEDTLLTIVLFVQGSRRFVRHRWLHRTTRIGSAGCSHERSGDETVRAGFAFEVVAEVGMGE